MNILITHAYTQDNKGDAAILSVMLSQLRIIFPKSQIKILSLEDSLKNKTFEGATLISSFLFHSIFTYKNYVLKIIYTTYIITFTLIWASVFRLFHVNISIILHKPIKLIAEEFRCSDIIIPIGGGYLRAKPTIVDTLNLILLIHPILLSIILKKPVIMYSQTVGPFYNTFQKFITRIVLNRTKLIIAREDITVNYLKTIGIRDDLVVKSVDAGFLLKENNNFVFEEIIPAKILFNKTLIGITVRNWLPKNEQQNYEQEFAYFIDKVLLDKSCLIIFIPQVTSVTYADDDREVATRMVKLIHNKNQIVNLTGKYSHHQIKALYSNLNFLVGTRFHSVIFALTNHIPTIAIEYEYKTSGIMKDLNLSKWVIKIEDVNSNLLVNKFTKLLEEKEEYLNILNKNLPPYIKEAENTVNLVKEAYLKSK